MDIHSELMMAFVKWSESGGSPLTRITGLPDLHYRFSHTVLVRGTDQLGYQDGAEPQLATPDIIAGTAPDSDRYDINVQLAERCLRGNSRESRT